MRKKSVTQSKPVLYFNTSLRWNSMWSHSHELSKGLANFFSVYYYEPPRLTTTRSAVLYDKNNFEKPQGMYFISSDKSFKTLGLKYFLHYQFHSIVSFFKKRDEFDVYIVYNIYELPTLLLAKLWRKKVIFVYADEYDSLTTIKNAKPFLRFSLKQFLKKADLIVATARVLEIKAKKINNHVVYIPNGVNLEDRKNLPAVQTRKSKKEFVVGFLGAIESWVDYSLILDAAREFQNNNVSVRFEIIGDGDSLPSFKKAARGLTNVHFVGYVPHKDVYKYVSQWDVATIPFHINEITNSVSPVKLFEYWLANKPVIATPTKELVQFKDMLLLPSSSEQFVNSIYKLMKQPELRRKYAEQGRNLVLKKYNWGVYIKQYAQHIERLIKSR